MDSIDRRDFIKTVAGSVAFAGMEGRAASPPDSGPTFLSTWVHGKPANERAADVFKGGGSLLDAVEKGINVPESDPNVTSVGYGGIPNAEGIVELDAAIMDGARHRAGSVCNLHMFKNPISVARLVMEKTRHTTLAGEGAFRFALKMGFEPQTLLTPQSLQKWQEWKADPHRKTFWVSPENHDTIGMVATDGKGHVVSGCSTSGLAFKIPGRVGDSPILGAGLYVDNEVGAAGSTGRGESNLLACSSVMIVEWMRQGKSPQEASLMACERVVRMTVEKRLLDDGGKPKFDLSFYALNRKGEHGGASLYSGARYSVNTGEKESHLEDMAYLFKRVEKK